MSGHVRAHARQLEPMSGSMSGICELEPMYVFMRTLLFGRRVCPDTSAPPGGP